MEEDLTAFLRTQQVLGADVHVHHHQLIRNARPIPPARHQVAVAGGRESAELLGLVALSTLTSFGGGEAYVGVADGIFVAGGHLDQAVFYGQLVPVANALPGPILVKLAAAIGFVGRADAGLVAAGTALAAVVMSLVERAQDSPVVRDLGAAVLPVISGLLVTTSVSMLGAVARIATDEALHAAGVVGITVAAILLVVRLRERSVVPDPVLVLACGGLSTAAMMAW